MARPTKKKTTKRAVRTAKQARSKATFDAIIEAATRILAETGWAALNTNAIAVRAGVSVGSVYEYFPNKQAILDVIIDRHLEAGEVLLAEAVGALTDAPSPDRVVGALVSGFVRLHQDEPRLHRVLSSEVPISTTQKVRAAALRENTITLVAVALGPQVKDARLRATLLVDTADSLTHRWFVDEVGLPVSADCITTEVTRMLQGYVLAVAGCDLE